MVIGYGQIVGLIVNFRTTKPWTKYPICTVMMGLSRPKMIKMLQNRRTLPSSTYAALKRRSVELAGGGQMFYWAQLLAGMEFPRDATDAAAASAGESSGSKTVMTHFV